MRSGKDKGSQEIFFTELAARKRSGKAMATPSNAYSKFAKIRRISSEFRAFETNKRRFICGRPFISRIV
jgi:hypothetical protein